MANVYETLPRELSPVSRVPTITCNYAKLRTLRALSTAFMPHEITFGSNESETDREGGGGGNRAAAN